MAAPNRSAILTKAHKVLKKHYTPVKPADESVLKTILYACCLENAHFEKADEAFARLQEMYFDWNELRVTTVSELAQIMDVLPQRMTAAARFKRCLQNIFETHYSFDVDFLRKQNIGKAEKQLEKYGVTPFGVAYVKQNALGGHAIAVDQGTLDVLVILGAVTEQEAKKNTAPGLERAIAKSKGVEFGSLLHQLGADFFISPHGQKPRKVIVEIDPEAKDRLPKRGVKKTPKTKSAQRAAKKKGSKSASAKVAPEKAKAAKTAKKSASKRLSKKKPR